MIGAGAQLIDVYSELFAHGVTIPAGSCATVGIAGLALGGGVGFTSRAFGLTCDNIESLQIVTAAGQLLTCDTSHHSDLFWACRGGGGGNFGIVTSFTFKTHPISTVATYYVEWPWNQALQAVQAWQAFAPTAPDALFSVCDLEATDPSRAGRPLPRRLVRPVLRHGSPAAGPDQAARRRGNTDQRDDAHTQRHRGRALLGRLQQRDRRPVPHEPARHALALDVPGQVGLRRQAAVGGGDQHDDARRSTRGRRIPRSVAERC